MSTACIRQAADPPLHGITEQVDVQLVLLDVTMVDNDRSIVTGLTKEDFVLLLDHEVVPIVSLDMALQEDRGWWLGEPIVLRPLGSRVEAVDPATLEGTALEGDPLGGRVPVLTRIEEGESLSWLHNICRFGPFAEPGTVEIRVRLAGGDRLWLDGSRSNEFPAGGHMHCESIDEPLLDLPVGSYALEVTVSVPGRDDVVIGAARQYGVMRSGIDAEAFRTPGRSRDEVRDELGYAPEDFVVGTIADMKPQTAPLDFVETALRARTKNPAFRFFFAGDGQLMPQVRQHVEDAGLSPVVNLLGWREDVPDLLHAMDAFLLTSRFEGLPRSVLQAMAAGVPVVATAVDGTPEVVEDGVSGALADPGDHERLAGHLDRLARDDAHRRALVAAARGRIDDEFDIRKMVADLDALYALLLQAAPAALR